MTFIAGDLGGTKTLLAVYEWNPNPKKVYQSKFLSNNWSSFYEMLSHFLKGIPSNIQKPTHGCIAVAGPVVKGSSKITNLNWHINERRICKLAHLERLELINDFAVLVYGISHLNDQQYIAIQNTSLDQSCLHLQGSREGP